MTKPQGMFLLALLLVSVSGVRADGPELNEYYPRHYTVRQGDTLWDISARFLRQPWRWPELWRHNPQLDSPHLIYPGDELVLQWIDGRPRLMKRREREGVVRLVPRMRAAAVPTVSLSTIVSFTDGYRLLDKAELAAAAYLVGDGEGRRLLIKGEEAYARGRLVPGGLYGVYREQGPLLPGARRDEQRVALVGTLVAREQVRDTLARVAITSQRQEMRQGDLLLPLAADGTLAAFYFPRPGPELADGEVIAMGREGSVAGRNGVVFINGGEAEGVRPGDLYGVLKPGPGIYDYDASALGQLRYADSASRYLRNTGPAELLPAEPVARIMVFRVYRHASAALILDSKALIRSRYPLGPPGDGAR